jgi:hypothetical protein
MVNVRLMTAAGLFQSPEFLATIKPEQGKRRQARGLKRSWTLFVGAPDARSHRYADVHASDITRRTTCAGHGTSAPAAALSQLGAMQAR